MKSDIHKSAELFMERFPALGLMMGTWEPKEAPSEAIPPIHVDTEDLLYFYGLREEVYFQCKEWLQQPDKRLVFLEDEPGIIASFLHRPAAVEILSHPGVHIELLGDLTQLAQKFPVRRIAVAGPLSKKKLRRIRLELLRKTALAYGLHIDRLHGYQIFRNWIRNLTHVPGSFYANGLKGAFPNVPAVVCGAGPSLAPTIETLRTLENRALIIAGGSTLAALSSRGIMPHFGMAVDPNVEEYHRFRNSFAFDVPLLYSTRVHPDIFRTCNGPFGYMRSGIGGIPELWMEEELGLLDPLIGDVIAPETISVTSFAIAFAQFLGCNPILLNGIDMAYTGGARYAPGVVDHANVVLDAPATSALDCLVRKKDRNGKRVYSAVRWVMESASISHFAKQHKAVQFLNTTSGGIGFKGIDYVPLEEAVSSFPEQNLREQVFAHIAACQMPAHAADKIKGLLKELRQSLERLIAALEILAGEKKGSKALAELEIEEEMATLFLFYDVRQILKSGLTFWPSWLELARRYAHMFRS
ncbi:MAG: DUF115 domain-containing protein [Verrucomicrobia bacterium]|nr:DUF115 domain-containing protein [Verrucomicrobiota bacterium]MDE3047389.1 DUF115 domain-containing protein [Verrucomicrobiota bacterium]